MLVVTVFKPTMVAPSAGAVIHSFTEYAKETGELVAQLPLVWATVELVCEAANVKKQLTITSLRIHRNIIKFKENPKYIYL